MKTYLFDTINRYKRFSEKLDVQTAICNKSWWVFNDSGEKELYIFNPDGSLDVSFGGRVTEGKWRYVSANKSIIITANTESFMLDPEFIDNAIFALKLNGTNQYVFMIDENNTTLFAPKTYKELMGYFEEKFNAAFALEEARIKAEAKRIEAEAKRKKEEREREEKEKLTLYYQQKWIREKFPREVYEKYKKISNVSSYFMLGSGAFMPLSLCFFGIIDYCIGITENYYYVFFFLFLPICFIFMVSFGLALGFKDRCWFYLNNCKDETFDVEWEKSWDENRNKNLELYEENVDLKEIKNGCLKAK